MCPSDACIIQCLPDIRFLKLYYLNKYMVACPLYASTGVPHRTNPQIPYDRGRDGPNWRIEGVTVSHTMRETVKIRVLL